MNYPVVLPEQNEQLDINGKPIFDHSALVEKGNQSVETQRMISLAKQEEERSVQVSGLRGAECN